MAAAFRGNPSGNCYQTGSLFSLQLSLEDKMENQNDDLESMGLEE
jgi:hypothetical protein